MRLENRQESHAGVDFLKGKKWTVLQSMLTLDPKMLLVQTFQFV